MPGGAPAPPQLGAAAPAAAARRLCPQKPRCRCCWAEGQGPWGRRGCPAVQRRPRARACGKVRPLSYQDLLCSLSGTLGLLSQVSPLALQDRVKSSGRLGPGSLPPLGIDERHVLVRNGLPLPPPWLTEAQQAGLRQGVSTLALELELAET